MTEGQRREGQEGPLSPCLDEVKTGGGEANHLVCC